MEGIFLQMRSIRKNNRLTLNGFTNSGGKAAAYPAGVGEDVRGGGGGAMVN